MSNRTLNLDDHLYQYVLDVSLREHPAQKELRDVTRSHPFSEMQISPEQGQFMAMLIKLIDARRTIEVGVFTGYSALSVALALPPDGHIIACDVSHKYTDTAHQLWKKAGVSHKIDLRIAPALDTLHALIAEEQAGQFDFAFIDADKVNYDAYYENCLALLHPGGLIAIDNTLRQGRVAHPAQNEDTAALQALNKKLHQDERIDLSLLPISDGLTLARKR
jgi:predicted O-methyltransferase YrrM